MPSPNTAPSWPPTCSTARTEQPCIAKGARHKSSQAPDGFPYHGTCFRIKMNFPDPFEENRRRGGHILAIRVGVCVPFAPLAPLALHGSVALNAFALPLHPPTLPRRQTAPRLLFSSHEFGDSPMKAHAGISDRDQYALPNHPPHPTSLPGSRPPSPPATPQPPSSRPMNAAAMYRPETSFHRTPLRCEKVPAQRDGRIAS
jgi:hypothetical protein